MIGIPEKSMVLLIGPAGAGKTTYAVTHFPRPAILSSDRFREMVSDSEDDQDATALAFEVLQKAAEARCKMGRLVVIDATNLKQEDRVFYRRLAQAYDYTLIYIVFDYRVEVALWRNTQRRRQVSEGTIRRHFQQLAHTQKQFAQEKVHRVIALQDADKEGEKFYFVNGTTEHYEDHGPFDIIGDVHGCHDELHELCSMLGYQFDDHWAHPGGRKLVFVGDLIDRGPKPLEVLTDVCHTIASGDAYMVMGNHDHKLLRKLSGSNVQLNNGLAETWAQVSQVEDYWKSFYTEILAGVPTHLVLDEGRLVVTHAGIREWMIGKEGKQIESFCLFGDTDGSTDPVSGYPVRRDWTPYYKGSATVVYGHQPQLGGQVYENNNTFNIDTACVFGGNLTALRYPEMETVQVAATRTYAERN